MTCPLCGRRKARRACPAKGFSICAQCCGAKRTVEIDCPRDCAYLTGDHARGWENEAQRRRDGRRLYVMLQALSETQQQMLFALMLHVASLRATRRDLDDARLAQALTALRRTLETRSHGIFYEHAPDDLRAQALAQELGAYLDTGLDGGPLGKDGDLAPVVAALADGVGETLREPSGPTAFLDTLTRAIGGATARPAGSRLIVE
jgi:hypothetical protein